MSTHDGGPAFPNPIERSMGDFGKTDGYPGMSLRDYFAAKVVPAGDMEWKAEILMGEPRPKFASDHVTNLAVITWWATAEAKYRYMVADAMLAARERKGAEACAAAITAGREGGDK